MTTILDDYRKMKRPAVIVFGKPACQQCRATERWLDKRDITYTAVDIAEDQEAAKYVRGLGFQQAPVVVTSEGDQWAGFQPDKLGELL